MKVTIIGNGLFGAMATIACAVEGHEVTVIDDAAQTGRPTGSAPAACLMRPSWMTGLGPVAKSGLGWLDEHFGLDELWFKTSLGVTVKVFWVPPRRIFESAARLRNHLIEDSALAWEPNGTVLLSKGQRIASDVVLVAAGVWCSELVRGLSVKRLAGCAVTVAARTPQPTIKVWAPYRQIVRFEREPGTTWIGDGSAIKQDNWTTARQQESVKRCLDEVGPTKLLKVQYGLRPYVDDEKAGLLRRIANRVWVSTGGAKNGTVIAAHQAKLFVQHIGEVLDGTSHHKSARD